MKSTLSFFFLCCLLFSQALYSWQGKKIPPNIIVILADDLGYGDLGCYGHPTIRTPNMDRMAREGMRFTQFYVAANVCTPSRAALLTGRLPVRYGVAGSENRGVFFPNSSKGLPQTELTIARLLKSVNYTTGVIGKWHLGHLPQYLPASHGFDYYFGIPYSNDMRPENENGGWPALPVYRNTHVIEQGPDQTGLTKRYTDEAVEFIRKNKDKPFFLYYPNNFPHVPLYASKDFSGTSKRGLYGDVVSELDWSVGKVLATLKELKLDKNTLVIFTSDNGPWLTQKENGGSAGLLFEGKGSAYEGGMRVPAIAWWPGTIKEGQISEALATTMDILPTVASLSGASLPTDRAYDGESMLPLFTGQKKQVREMVFYYHRTDLYAVRKGPWKAYFITKPSFKKDIPAVVHDTAVLINIEADPSEKYDVSRQHPDVVKDLTAEYQKFKASVKTSPNLTDSIYWKIGAPPKEWWKGMAEKTNEQVQKTN